MAKQISLVQFDGNMDNINFFKRNGKPSARKKSEGFSKERIMNDPKLKKLRDHITEFPAVVLARRSVWRALRPVLKFRDGTLHHRLVQALMAVNKGSPGEKGKRPVLISMFKPILKRLELNVKSPLESSCLVDPVFTPSAARNSSTMQVSVDIPLMITPPAKATYFRLHHALGIVSDVAIDALTKQYAPLADEANGRYKLSTSELIALNSADPVDVTLDTVLPVETIPDSATVIELFGIEFFEDTPTGPEPMSDGKAMQVVNVF